MRFQKWMKRMAVAGMAGMLAAGSVVPALAAGGWTQVGDKKYYYYENGQMATGLLYEDGKYYYFLADGSMVTGWMRLDGDYYFMDENGVLTTGWRQLDGEWCYLRPESGKCVINDAIEIDGYWYFFKNDGKKLTGWLRKNNAYYYMDPTAEGRMVAGTSQMIDGVSYEFAADGVCTSAVNVGSYYNADTASTASAGGNAAASGQSSTSNTSGSGTRVVVAGGNQSVSGGPGMSY